MAITTGGGIHRASEIGESNEQVNSTTDSNDGTSKIGHDISSTNSVTLADAYSYSYILSYIMLA